MFKKLIIIIICIFFKYLYHAHRDLIFQTKYLNSSRFKVCFLNFVGCLNMSKRNSSISGNSNKYNQRSNRRLLEAQRQRARRQQDNEEALAERRLLNAQRLREIGRKETEYEIDERRLVDAVSHAQQTKNDVYS